MVSGQQLFDEVTYSLDEIITYLFVRLVHPTPNGHSSATINVSNEEGSNMFKEQRRRAGNTEFKTLHLFPWAYNHSIV